MTGSPLLRLPGHCRSLATPPSSCCSWPPQKVLRYPEATGTSALCLELFERSQLLISPFTGAAPSGGGTASDS